MREIKTRYNKRDKDMILTQFDSDENGIVNPCNFIDKVDGIPKIAIACYSVVTFEHTLLNQLGGD